MRSRRTAAVAALVAATVAYCLAESRGAGDLLIFLSAAGDVGQEDIYSKTYFDGYHYYYSVLFALILKPFFQLSYFWTKFAWLLANAGMFFALFRLAWKTSWCRSLSARNRCILFGGSFLYAIRFFHENQHASQVTILILFLSVYGLHFIFRGRIASGAAMLAGAINIKLLPVLFVPYLVYRKEYRAALLTVLFLAAFYLLPFVALEPSYYASLMQSWWQLVNPSNRIHVLDVDERSFHGLSTLLSTLLVQEVPDIHALPLKRNIADIPLSALANVLLTARAALLAFALYFLRWPPFRKSVSDDHRVTECAYLLLVIPLVFPHQQHYAFLFTLPAYAVCLYATIVSFGTLKAVERTVAIGALAFVYLTANLRILVGTYNAYYEHYKILTYGALVLIPLLAWARRRVLAKPFG